METQNRDDDEQSAEERLQLDQAEPAGKERTTEFQRDLPPDQQAMEPDIGSAG